MRNAHEILRELVELKDIHDNPNAIASEQARYAERKPLVWAEARACLKAEFWPSLKTGWLPPLHTKLMRDRVAVSEGACRILAERLAKFTLSNPDGVLRSAYQENAKLASGHLPY